MPWPRYSGTVTSETGVDSCSAFATVTDAKKPRRLSSAHEAMIAVRFAGYPNLPDPVLLRFLFVFTLTLPYDSAVNVAFTALMRSLPDAYRSQREDETPVPPPSRGTRILSALPGVRMGL